MPRRISMALVAAFVAALVYAVAQVVNAAAGWAPLFNAPEVASRLLGTDAHPVVAWLLHFGVYGLVLGLLFGIIGPKLARIGYAMRGVLFALVTWAVVAFAVMPAAGAGLFGMRFGYAAVPLILIVHLLYGATLGGVYAKLMHKETAVVRPA